MDSGISSSENSPVKNSNSANIPENVVKNMKNDYNQGQVNEVKDLAEVVNNIQAKISANQMIAVLVRNSCEESDETIEVSGFSEVTDSQNQENDINEEENEEYTEEEESQVQTETPYLSAILLFSGFLDSISEDVPGLLKLITDLCEGNEYVEVTEENFINVCLLKRRGVVIEHPNDSTKIKLSFTNK